MITNALHSALLTIGFALVLAGLVAALLELVREEE